MKEALVAPGVVVRIVDSPIPEPNDDQVLIKVIVSGSNPKDWKVPEMVKQERNEGDDIAGVVEKVGANVFEFKPGDRVAAFHQMITPHGSYAEYAIAWAHTTFHLPAKTTFEEAATIPLAGMTATLGLYRSLALPSPWDPQPSTTHPLLIYGASSAVGYFALQLALHSNIHPLILVAGNAKDYLEPLIDRSKGDTILDYREGADALLANIRAALAGRPLFHAFDAISEQGSPQLIGKVLAAEAGPAGEKSKVTFVQGLFGPMEGLPEYVQQVVTKVNDVHMDEGREFGFVWFRYLARGLSEGWFRAQRVTVREGGLGGVQKALLDLKEGRVSGMKFVFRIGETEGVERE
ncbi:chaperonin 10-like protein [Podospora appendiculata]|uniref:Chaperonin 10-like protein n=1 Tax=Podospora appendiculata TaxID=314037 RepID=A0AAE0XB72_9PEZI|nr:chaperonin 10-like protein [Podospora appendiculata]